MGWPKTTEIGGLKVYRSLEEIDKPIDMVEVFGPFWKPRLDLPISNTNPQHEVVPRNMNVE